MSALVLNATLPAISPETLVHLRTVEQSMSTFEQAQLTTEHILHGGMYSRTVRFGAEMIICGALIKRATILIINGAVELLAGDDWAFIDGYNVIAASAGRKQVYVTRGPVEMTMIFPTRAETVEEAEAEFTDDQLLSRMGNNEVITITGE